MKNEILSLKEYQRILISAIKRVYKRIYKFDITNNCVPDDETREYLQVDGFCKNENFDDIVKQICETVIEESFRFEFLELYSRENIEKLYKNGIDSFVFEYLRLEQGEFVWYRDICNIFCVNDVIKVMIFIENIDKSKKIERQIFLESKIDKCTDVYNKATVIEKISAILKYSDEQNAIFVVDIDNFKQINDNYGHQFGDLVIKMVASKLKNSFREIDIIGRIGGDEFVVLLIDIKKNEAVHKKCAEIKARTKEITFAEHPNLSINLSVGVAINNPKENYESLFKRADDALYSVKRGGRNGCEIAK